MQLKTKFIIMVALVTCCSYGVTFYRTSSFQEELVVQQATRQARMLFDQIRITRQWVADHNGLFLVKEPGVEANPFLRDGKIQDDQGNWLVKRNPAMVTRELSAYAAREGMGQFNVTSLKPKNPDNRPDRFERDSLKQFEAGAKEAVILESVDNSSRLRYMAPLIVDSRCLKCHGDQNYLIGDIRGGMSVSIPIDWAFSEIKENNRLLLNIAIATIVIVSLTIYFLFDLLVARRLKVLALQMSHYPEQPLRDSGAGDTLKDEIGSLNNNFIKLCRRLERSQQDLDATREQVFQNEKQAALGRLVAGISHEINNPLGGMQNCVKTMQASLDQPELQQRYLGLLGQGIERIKSTVQLLLNIGRKEPLQISTGDLDAVIRDCLELSCLGHKNIDLQLQLGIGQPVTTGIEAVRQVLLNLAGNAVQAIGAEHGIIQVRSSLTRDTIRIEVLDNGPGIDPDHLDKIFEPFFTTKEVGQGTGLGLSISHSLLQRLGGKLDVVNQPAGGACFTLTLPLATEEQPCNHAS